MIAILITAVKVGVGAALISFWPGAWVHFFGACLLANGACDQAILIAERRAARAWEDAFRKSRATGGHS
jgi:hypothetical protein